MLPNICFILFKQKTISYVFLLICGKMSFSYKIHPCTGIIEWPLQTCVCTMHVCICYLVCGKWRPYKTGTVRSYRLVGVNW